MHMLPIKLSVELLKQHLDLADVAAGVVCLVFAVIKIR